MAKIHHQAWPKKTSSNETYPPTLIPKTNPRHHFLQHNNGMNGVKKYNRWKCWWVALNWSIWQHRNKVIFMNVPFNVSRLMEDALFLV